ncbi:MAG: hypothetical protein ACK40L_05630 [Hydrogenophaga sp.]
MRIGSRSRRLLLVLVLLLPGAMSTAWAQPPREVQIAYRLQPGVDWISELTTDAIMSFTVLEDRGIVARSAARGVRFPAQANLVNRQTVRHTTSPLAADGSFTVDLAFLSRSAAVRDADGQERLLAEAASLVGSRVRARASAEGRIDPASLEVLEAPPAQVAQVRPVFQAMFEQMGSLDNLHLSDAQSASQRVQLTLPIPGLAQVDIGMDITYQLIGIREDIADIDMVYVMDFGTPQRDTRIRAHGSGAGLMRYDTRHRLILSTTDHSLMDMELDMPEGRIRVQVMNQQKQLARLADGR